ncbi:CASP-like protein 1F1 [Olea europaea var. sylvestris]|uniref:CASP-like protein 1F1 n=1 Tax=Olea europaea var. sylvestris TaxID=158386 RepID=UPI000C1CD942|nr:CASP-like protein 1F1 [Olea europaea var. sylvestris]
MQKIEAPTPSCVYPVKKGVKPLLYKQHGCLAIAGTLATTRLTLTSKQTVVVFRIIVDARYSYSSSFNSIFVYYFHPWLQSCGFKKLLLRLSARLGFEIVRPTILTMLLMSGCTAAIAIGYLGKYGNNHTGWIGICDHFTKYCSRIMLSVMLSFICVMFYLFLTVNSVNVSRKI